MPQDRVLVWDLPLRLFHWLLAIGVGLAALIALVADDEGALFPYHALIGLVLLFVVALRVAWGLVGSESARLGGMAFGPTELLEYLRAAMFGVPRRYSGHNPGSAWAAMAMFALIAGLGITGVAIGQGQENLEDVHELLAYGLLAVVVVHLTGLVVHAIRLGENPGLSMLDGMKVADASGSIPSSRPMAALLSICMVGAFGVSLFSNFDAGSRTLRVPLTSAVLSLGEADDHHGQGWHRQHDDD